LLDCVRHATPILATDLASALIASFERDLHGIYHIAGAERVNPARFVQELARTFDLPFPARANIGSLSERPTGFGQGEASLHTRKIRKTLDIAMPLLADGLARLFMQTKDGYRELLNGSSVSSHERVA
jgi:dTDP-4-dehydrorhamnose reductase